MKFLRIILILLLLASLGRCKKPGDKIIICGSRCPASTPWKVESLDLGLPCFVTKEACLQWATTHGYGGKPCVKCD